MNTKEELREAVKEYLIAEYENEGFEEPARDYINTTVTDNLVKIFKSRESALLSRVNTLIGSDDDPGMPAGEGGMDEDTKGWYRGRNQLRATQRTKLDQLSEEIE